MIAISYYLLKVILCSGILYGYFHFALRNKVFHEWNRFYLLATVPVSILLPLINIEINTTGQHSSKIINALEIVNGADEYVLKSTAVTGIHWSMEMISIAAYLSMSLLTIVLFSRAIIKISGMLKKYSPVKLDHFYFINTNEKGTPFSFFKYLFWNEEISVSTENGKRILEHEMVHIREKHSWDKIFIHLVLIVLWINPFYWLIRQELTMIHEFIADKKSVGNGDVNAFAKLILEASFPGHSSLLTNSFFQSSIKRRLTMITKQQNPKFLYLSKLMMIPLIFLLVFTFAVKAKTMMNKTNPIMLKLEKVYTVVLDAGHGGTDAGTVSGSLQEKDINLALAKLVYKLNKNQNIKLVLTRNSDVFMTVREKAEAAASAGADLFISFHAYNNSPELPSKGILLYISSRDTINAIQNARFASLLLENLSSVYTVEKKIRQREDKGIWVLDHNNYPSVMIELGNIGQTEDRKFITSPDNQEKIATKILESIEDYFSNSVVLQPYNAALKDTLPKDKKQPKTLTTNKENKNINVKEVVEPKVGNQTVNQNVDAKTVENVNVTTNANVDISNDVKPINNVPAVPNVNKTNQLSVSPAVPVVPKLSPLYILDGKVITEEEMKRIDPNMIASVDVLKDETTTKKYGERGKNGVIVITLKK